MKKNVIVQSPASRPFVKCATCNGYVAGGEKTCKECQKIQAFGQGKSNTAVPKEVNKKLGGY